MPKYDAYGELMCISAVCAPDDEERDDAPLVKSTMFVGFGLVEATNIIMIVHHHCAALCRSMSHVFCKVLKTNRRCVVAEYVLLNAHMYCDTCDAFYVAKVIYRSSNDPTSIYI